MRSTTWLADQLPAGMSENTFLLEFLSIFQHLSDTVLDQVDTLPDVFDANVAPPTMVRAMAEWMGVDWIDPELDDRLQRDTVLAYSRGLPRRGATSALVALLQVLCCEPDQRPDDVVVTVTETCADPDGAPGVVLLDDPSSGWPHPIAAKVEVHVPSTGSYRVDDLIRIVRGEIPIDVLLSMCVGETQVWPEAEPDDRLGDAAQPDPAQLHYRPDEGGGQPNGEMTT